MNQDKRKSVFILHPSAFILSAVPVRAWLAERAAKAGDGSTIRMFGRSLGVSPERWVNALRRDA
jgi:hypothetical protein